jgi:hypothetical protein
MVAATADDERVRLLLRTELVGPLSDSSWETIKDSYQARREIYWSQREEHRMVLDAEVIVVGMNRHRARWQGVQSFGLLAPRG